MLQLEGLQLEELAMPLREGLERRQREGLQLEELAMLLLEATQWRAVLRRWRKTAQWRDAIHRSRRSKGARS